ncbi:glycoside hydrolase family 16 protein [Mucilaginibacter sp. FT3.2]|uniref:glycoside hydrolase family 16 protein n=1 Tax=Mucilaginibacter sp. FT3.2 TaxID=2723090 RepID=UPI00161881C3|nr:glycoside hydrolase family 16 protein [Mucilaginibacter sp. FT3.2]MBB6232919.1 beta-glucanase (GH16 family) [Mucilaginibacter sp. FT3.2]
MNRVTPAFAILILLPGLLLAQASNVKSKRKPIWSDEFNYNGLPDTTKWGYEQGFVRNQELQYYTVKRPENCRVENGCLVIETRKETYPNAAYLQGSAKWNQKEQFAQYTSASINTKGKESWKYGRIEMRAKVPGGLGSWPAFWMLGYNKNTVKWPACGEIDIMEFLGRDSAKVYGTVHYADTTGQLRDRGSGPVVGKPADGFHIYAIEWDDKQIAFYYDSLKYFVFELSTPNGSSGNIFQKDFYLLLNTALGHQGSWAGPVDDKILPIKYYIDYVRVYQ